MGGGGGMTEPTNLVKTQPNETTTYTVKAVVHDDGRHTDAVSSGRLGDGNTKLSATTSFHIGITIKPDKNIPSRRVWAWISYYDDAGAINFANSSKISYVIPAGVWTRLEWTVTVPAGMILYASHISIDRLADEIKFQATNFVVYPLTGGRIVRARGANDGSKPTGVMTWNGTKGTLKTKEYSVDDVCTIQSDPNLKCINFVFE